MNLLVSLCMFRAMRMGLFGFPKVGKTTLFNTLTGLSVPTNVYAAGKPEVHVGMAKVPDPRLDRLSAMFQPKKTVFAKVEYLDVVGVEKGQGESETFLGDLKNVDALLHVVRDFDSSQNSAVDPKKDIEVMETELILADHTVISKRIEKLEANVKKANREEDKKEIEFLKPLLASLEKEIPLREVKLLEEQAKKIRGYNFLSAKPLLVAVNISESDIVKIQTKVSDLGLEAFSKKPHVVVVPVSALIEMEISQLSPEDGQALMKDYGILEPCLHRLIQSSYELLGLISFFTVGEDECRAWTIPQGTNAHKSAGVIHSDIERGFIRAEVIAYEELMAAGTWAAAKAHGKLRLEGKEYVVKNGDIVHFRFNT